MKIERIANGFTVTYGNATMYFKTIRATVQYVREFYEGQLAAETAHDERIARRSL